MSAYLKLRYLPDIIMKKRKEETQESTEEFDHAVSETRNDKYILGLYIAGTRNRSVLALTNLKKICEEHLQGQYELEVIDIYQKPGMAKDDQIIAAPTLIRKLPLPSRRITGDMSNVEELLADLKMKRVEEL